jgi:hypothetical protein
VAAESWMRTPKAWTTAQRAGYRLASRLKAVGRSLNLSVLTAFVLPTCGLLGFKVVAILFVPEPVRGSWVAAPVRRVTPTLMANTASDLFC